MGQPITWQNVNQGDVNSAWRAMDSAQRSMNGAFDGLQGVIKGSEDVQAKNDVAIRNNNSQDYLNKLNTAFKSPEDLAAGITDGRVDALKASYGNSIDHEKVRGAAEALLNTKYAQSKAGMEYSNTSTDFKQQGTVDSILSKINSGDPLQVAAGKAEFDAHPELRNKAAIAQAANGAGYQLVTRDREAKKFTDDMLTTKNQRETATKNAESQRIQAGASVESAHAATTQAATARANMFAGLQKDAEERQLKAAAGLGSINSHLLGSPEGGAEISKTVAGIQDEDVRAAAARIVTKLPRDAQAADVTNLIQSINKSYNLFKRTSDDEILSSFEPVYKASKADKTQSGIVEARKGIYSNAAARALNDSNAMRDQLAAALPGYRASAPAVATPAVVTPSPAAPAAPVTTAMVPTPAGAPVAVATPAQQAAELRSFVKAPGGPRIDTGVGALSLDPSGKPDAFPVLTRAVQANIQAEVAKAKAAEAAGKTAKANEHKANIAAMLKQNQNLDLNVLQGD